MLSASTSPELIAAALRRGASAYLAKSVDPSDLPSTLRQVLEARRDAAPRTLEPERMTAASSRRMDRSYTIVTWMSLGTFDRGHATVMNTVRIAIPFAALAALTGGWLMVWRALRPLSVMAAQADGMDPRHLQARLPVPPPRDELRRLAVAFNALLDRLSKSVNAQRRFMADASHELRTPVSVVRTAAQVTLSEAHRSEPEYREALTSSYPKPAV